MEDTVDQSRDGITVLNKKVLFPNRWKICCGIYKYSDHVADLQSLFCREVFCRRKFYRTEFIGNFPLSRTTQALAAPDAR